MLTEFHELLGRLERTSSKTEKVAILRATLGDRPEMGQLLQLALSPYITFGIAKLPELGTKYGEPGGVLNWRDLLDKLAKRELTGNKALAEIDKVRLTFSEKEREAFDRILLKDLRAGFSESSVNKAVPGTVPVFECQLAVSEMPKLDELKFPIYVEPKLDGVRTIAINKNNTLTLYSRNGGVFENFVEIENALATLPKDVVLDGEIISPQGFSDLMTRAKAKPGKHDDVPIEYHIFDAIRLDHWERQHCPEPLKHRKDNIKNWLPAHHARMLQSVVTKLCYNADDVEAFYKDCVVQGYEGIMLKDPMGGYTFKRNKTWRKLKPFDTVDLKVTGIVEGTGKYAGKMGALTAFGEHDGKTIITEIGSGFTDEDRERWMTAWVTSPIIEVRYQEITKAQDSDTYSLRFPSFVRTRPDKAA